MKELKYLFGYDSLHFDWDRVHRYFCSDVLGKQANFQVVLSYPVHKKIKSSFSTLIQERWYCSSPGESVGEFDQR